MLATAIFYLVFGITLIIIVAHLSLVSGLFVNRLRDRSMLRWMKKNPDLKKLLEEENIRLSVIVSSKDEEKNLPFLLESLENQAYGDFEIVLINDRSKDATLDILKAFKGKHGDRVKIIDNREEPVGCNPKQFALDLGITRAEGNLFLFTDADCILPHHWTEYYLYYFARFRKIRTLLGKRVGLLFGQILVRHDNSFLQRYQKFDQMLIHQYNSGSAGMGLLTGCFGNNLAIEKELLDIIGGFRALGYTPTEDAALLGAAGKVRGWTGRVASLEEMAVRPAPQATWRDFFIQHIRWNTGGFYADDLASRISYRSVVLYLVISIILLPLAFFHPFLFIMPATSFVFPGLLGMTAGLLYYDNRVGFLLRFIPYMIFFMLFYSLVTVLAMFKVKVKWKDSEIKL